MNLGEQETTSFMERASSGTLDHSGPFLDIQLFVDFFGPLNYASDYSGQVKLRF